MIRAGANQPPFRADGTAEPLREVEQKLALAEKTIQKLETKVADQQRQIRELRAQGRQAQGINTEYAELKAEAHDLKGEIRELTRANREQVTKIEVLKAENDKLRAEAKARKPQGINAGGMVERMLEPSLP